MSAYGTTTPRRTPLSHHDWICAGCSPDLEVLALNERGSILVGRIADWDDRLHSVFPQLPPLAGHPELRMSHRAAAAKVDEDLSVELSKFTGHILNCALAGCTSVGYAYCLTPSDDAVMRAGALLEFIEDGRDFASREIDKLLASAAPSEDEDGERPAGSESIQFPSDWAAAPDHASEASTAVRQRSPAFAGFPVIYRITGKSG